MTFVLILEVQTVCQPQLADELDALCLAGVPVVGLGRPRQVVRRLGRDLIEVVHQSLVIC